MFNAYRAYLFDLSGESGPISPPGIINEGICQNYYHNYLRQRQSDNTLDANVQKRQSL